MLFEAASAAYDALQVFLLDPKLRAWLDANDPMAVRQALSAVDQLENALPAKPDPDTAAR